MDAEDFLSPDDEDDDAFDDEENLCQGCEEEAELNRAGLCASCADKLERDLIRKREWRHVPAARKQSKEALELLRNRIIKEYGKALELIAEEAPEISRNEAEKRALKKAKRRKRRQRGV